MLQKKKVAEQFILMEKRKLKIGLIFMLALAMTIVLPAQISVTYFILFVLFLEAIKKGKDHVIPIFIRQEQKRTTKSRG